MRGCRSSQEQIRCFKKNNHIELKIPKEKRGIVSKPLLPFIIPHDYNFPLLNFKIFAVNNLLDCFVKDQVEIISDGKKLARNFLFNRVKDTLQQCRETEATV